MADPLSLLYLPVAVGLGALHALEPGHSKTLIAAYLIGTHGTRRDALLLGLSAATTHSLVVIALATTAWWIGKETLTGDAAYWLQVGSGLLVLVIGAWLLWRRSQRAHRHHHHDQLHHDHQHDHHHNHNEDGEELDAHARAHLASMPAYVAHGQRPSVGQVILFGAAGGLLPCSASVTVMLLALSVGNAAFGVLAVLCFSVGLAVAMVGVGLLVVAGYQRLTRGGRLAWITQHAPLLSAWAIMLSGAAAVAVALVQSNHAP